MPVSHFAEVDDGERAKSLTLVLGCALLTALSAIEQAGELKADSKYVDLTLVISYFLEWSHDLPKYGMEGLEVS